MLVWEAVDASDSLELEPEEDVASSEVSCVELSATFGTLLAVSGLYLVHSIESWLCILFVRARLVGHCRWVKIIVLDIFRIFVGQKGCGSLHVVILKPDAFGT